MTLNRLHIHLDHLDERVQRHVTNVVVLVLQEPTQNVHREHA